MGRVGGFFVSFCFFFDSGYRSIHLNVRLKGDKRVVEIQLRALEHHFFLISTGSDGIPDFMGFNIFEDAERAYFDKFVNNNDNRNIVLTHLQEASFTKISIAYSNYFLTFNNTIMQVLVYLSDAVTNSYHQNKVSSFCRYYQCFLDMIAFWIEEQRLEMTSYNKDNIARNSRLLRTEWTNSINNGINALNYIMWKMHQRLSFNLLNIVPYYRMKQIQKQFKRKYGHANH